MTRPSFTIGIEEEYQTIDPETRDLRSHIHAEIVQKGKTLLAERVKPEMHQSVVEIGTGVCRNIQEAHEEIRDIRRQIIGLARENGLRLAAGLWPGRRLCRGNTNAQPGHACGKKPTAKSPSSNKGNHPVHPIPHVLRSRRASRRVLSSRASPARPWNLGTHSDGNGRALSSGMLV